MTTAALFKRHDELVQLLLGWLSVKDRARLARELYDIRGKLGDAKPKLFDREPHRVPRAQRKLCWACADLPHRRPKRGCPECRKPYVPEPPITLAYVESLPRRESRVMPEGVGFK